MSVPILNVCVSVCVCVFLFPSILSFIPSLKTEVSVGFKALSRARLGAFKAPFCRQVFKQRDSVLFFKALAHKPQPAGAQGYSQNTGCIVDRAGVPFQWCGVPIISTTTTLSEWVKPLFLPFVVPFQHLLLSDKVLLVLKDSRGDAAVKMLTWN